MSTKQVYTGFPEAESGVCDYLVWSTSFPLPRFMRIESTEESTTCHMMWNENPLPYDKCVYTIRGFDLDLGFQVREDQWNHTRFIKFQKPSIHDVEIGMPNKPGRYYLYGANKIQAALDSHHENGLDQLDVGLYIEVVDYFGNSALIMLGDTKPMLSQKNDNVFYVELRSDNE